MTTYVKPWMLLASLLVNAALLGFIAAQGVRAFIDHDPRMAFRPPMERMGEDPRAILDRAFGDERVKIEESREAMDVAKRKIESLLQGDTLDPATFDSAMTEMQAVNARSFATLDRSLRKFAQMPPKERQAIANALAHMAPPGPPGPRMPGSAFPMPPPRAP